MNKIIRDIVVMGNKAISLPYSADFSLLSDGALPEAWVGDTFSISSGKAVNSATPASTLLTNGNFEGTFTSGLAASWGKYPAGTVVAESADVHGGSKAQSCGNATGAVGSVYQDTASIPIGTWIRLSAWAKIVTGTGFLACAQGFGGYSTIASRGIPSSSYTEVLCIGRASATGIHTVKLINNLHAVAETNTSIIDDAALQKYTTSQLNSYLTYSYSNVAVSKSSWTKTAVGEVFGHIGWWDGVADHQNCLIAYCDGVTAYLYKIVGTTQTLVKIGAITYVDGGDIEIRRPTGNTFQLWYNGTQVSTDATISDVEIINNKRFGLFTSGGGCACDAFFLV